MLDYNRLRPGMKLRVIKQYSDYDDFKIGNIFIVSKHRSFSSGGFKTEEGGGWLLDEKKIAECLVIIEKHKSHLPGWF